ncbi:MAG: hypothetical protein R3B99_28840 [Polyangiales bacterium]
MSESDVECEGCGAPVGAGLHACPYCQRAYRATASSPSVDCPVCGADNDTSRTTCAACGMSLLVRCVFCEQSSSRASVTCTRCGESFAGAEERKKTRDEEARREQMIELAKKGAQVAQSALSDPRTRSLVGGILGKLLDDD